MTKTITITVVAPEVCTDEQFEEWAKYELGYTASMSLDNPLSGWDLESETIEIS